MELRRTYIENIKDPKSLEKYKFNVFSACYPYLQIMKYANMLTTATTPPY